jgi:hypothetical protein
MRLRPPLTHSPPRPARSRLPGACSAAGSRAAASMCRGSWGRATPQRTGGTAPLPSTGRRLLTRKGSVGGRALRGRPPSGTGWRLPRTGVPGVGRHGYVYRVGRHGDGYVGRLGPAEGGARPGATSQPCLHGGRRPPCVPAPPVRLPLCVPHTYQAGARRLPPAARARHGAGGAHQPAGQALHGQHVGRGALLPGRHARERTVGEAAHTLQPSPPPPECARGARYWRGARAVRQRRPHQALVLAAPAAGQRARAARGPLWLAGCVRRRVRSQPATRLGAAPSPEPRSITPASRLCLARAPGSSLSMRPGSLGRWRWWP